MKFVHTADLQIGMTAPGAGTAARQLQDARVEVLRAILRGGAEKTADFVVIAGDMFENNRVSRTLSTQVARILEEAKPLRVFILPGNHDYYGPTAVYAREEFLKLGEHVKVFTERKPFVVPGCDVTLYPSPCFKARSNESPVRGVSTQPGTKYHVAVLHGSVPGRIGRNEEEDDYFPMTEQELRSLGMDYVALGHWHSLHPDPDEEPTSPFFYSGTPEPTRFGESMSGYALLVELDGEKRTVTKVPTGQYRFLDIPKHIAGETDVADLKRVLADISEPEKTLLRLQVSGIVSIGVRNLLDQLVEEMESKFASVQLDDAELSLEPDERDLAQFSRGGIAQTAFRILQEKQKEAPESERAKYHRAIALAYRAFKSELE